MYRAHALAAGICVLVGLTTAGACQTESESSPPVEDVCAHAAEPGCSEGLERIPAPETCAIIPSTATCGIPDPDAGCYDASDCTDQSGGYCHAEPGAEWCFCSFACMTDADCPGGACFCTAEGGRCEESDCRSNADCEGGQLCVEWIVDDCISLKPRWSCTTENDACRPNDDPCIPGETTCTPSASGATCVEIEVCG